MSKATYRCKLCGLEAWSKCRFQRTLFARNNGWSDADKVLYETGMPGKDATAEEITYFSKLWLEAGDQARRMFLCSHDWVCTSECMFGCCKPGDGGRG